MTDNQVDEIIQWALVHGSRYVQLLAKWLRWWHENDDAPAKMPDALHVDTMCELTELYVSAHCG